MHSVFAKMLVEGKAANVLHEYLDPQDKTKFGDFIPCVSYASNMLLASGLGAKNWLGWRLKDCSTPSIPAQGLGREGGLQNNCNSVLSTFAQGECPKGCSLQTYLDKRMTK